MDIYYFKEWKIVLKIIYNLKYDVWIMCINIYIDRYYK